MAAWRCSVLVLMLIASLASAQIAPTSPVPSTTPGSSDSSGGSSGGSYAGDGDYGGGVGGLADYQSPSPGGGGISNDYSSPSPDSTGGNTTPTDGTTTDPTAGAGTIDSTLDDYGIPKEQDPTVSGCRNKNQVIVPDSATCTDRCASKVDKAKGEATISPEVYTSKTGAGTCCNCNYERTPGIVQPGYVPADSSTPASSVPTILPNTTTTLDPSTFKPPNTQELFNAVNPAYTPPYDPKETKTYAVLRVTGGPWTLALPFDQILAFIYAFNNVTGVPWQYKGAAPSQPDKYPAAPYGLPQIRNGPPPLPAPVQGSPPLVVPIAPAPTDAPASTDVPVVVEASPDPAVIETLAAAQPSSAPVRRRKLLSNTLSAHRRRNTLQANPNDVTNIGTDPSQYQYDTNGAGAGDYLVNNSPGPGGEYGDYKSPSLSGDYSPPSPSSGGEYGDYNSPSPDMGGGGDYPSPSPTVDPMLSPSPIPEPSPSPSPPPAPDVVIIPPTEPSIELPPDMDGIWYFAMFPLSDSRFVAMARALNDATGEGSGAFLNYLKMGGVPAETVELRYFGQATEGQIDLTKRLDGDIFGASSGSSAPVSEPKHLSPAVIGAIVGGVCGAAVLVAVAAVLVASNRRKSSRAQKEALTQRWKTERELVEAERMKLEAAANGTSVYANGSARRTNPAHDAGFVAMTTSDLAQQRSMRRAATMEAEAKLSTRQLGSELSPSMSARSAQKPSRLESMRAALGLNKLSSAISKGGNTSSPAPAAAAAAATPPAATRSGRWTVEGANASPSFNAAGERTLRSQYSLGAGPNTPTRRTDVETGNNNGPSPWGRMFSKK